MPRIVSVGTAVPEHTLMQEEAREFARELFRDTFSDIDRYLPIFENSTIQTRRLARPREWFEEERPFSERNDAYTETACHLGELALERCLAAAGVTAQEIDHLFFVSTSGIATPSIDARLVHRLDFSCHVKRTPIWGLGCAGGAVGLARAYEYARAFPESRVMLLAVELCSLTFRRGDRTKSNLVATSLFADGAAAVLMIGDQVPLGREVIHCPQIIDTLSTTWPDSLDVMGWEVDNDGLRVVFSRDIPTLVRREVRPAVEGFLSRSGLEIDRLDRVIAHPGGMKVLSAYEETLGLAPDILGLSRSVLGEYGNMSSVTVLFVLEKELGQEHQEGNYGLLTALGPGFSSEMMLLQW
ncbi:15-methylpalmitoyl-4-hydroxy-2-pyrone synthase [Marininema mesophilum]|uniref:15-methylpalmitoyl-4-hydroxy-2-pyrone synthase n=1 Tax=Marininema mesophilum TaxID=1048340 RepID=A0A1H2YBY2_9BACL|nr:3-oxoacyl-[acyl-carrier-protein] synthase III C-terminal domain-containing protein [Marininema mesophilum]SDX02666.1 15-methylpalmitoyl-4-hydroxy-2-pyrone synthase [Marininema mesophilum]